MGIQVSRHQGRPSSENDIVVMIRAKAWLRTAGAMPRATSTTGMSTAMRRGAVLHPRPDRVPYR
jgi:hypothetical protein